MNIVLIGVRTPHSLESWVDVHGSDRSRHVTRDSAEVLELLGSDAEVWESTREDSVPAVEDSWMRPSVQRFQGSPRSAAVYCCNRIPVCYGSVVASLMTRTRDDTQTQI